jgi:hypothetical protein
MNNGLIYTSSDGREWTVTLEALEEAFGAPPPVEKGGAPLPEQLLRIVFTSGDDSISEEYTALTPLEDLSEDDLEEWYEAALRGKGL